MRRWELRVWFIIGVGVTQLVTFHCLTDWWWVIYGADGKWFDPILNTGVGGWWFDPIWNATPCEDGTPGWLACGTIFSGLNMIGEMSITEYFSEELSWFSDSSEELSWFSDCACANRFNVFVLYRYQAKECVLYAFVFSYLNQCQLHY